MVSRNSVVHKRGVSCASGVRSNRSIVLAWLGHFEVLRLLYVLYLSAMTCTLPPPLSDVWVSDRSQHCAVVHGHHALAYHPLPKEFSTVSTTNTLLL